MGELLSASRITQAIDKVGNQDGVASLEDLKPHQDDQQRVPLYSEEDFHKALRDLNRLCGDPSTTFFTPATLRCPVVKEGRFDPVLLEGMQEIFVLTQFRRVFENPLSDSLVKQRYGELMEFVRKHSIPLIELYHVFENYPPFGHSFLLERGRLKETKADSQKTVLFQMSLYAAMWHLKNNVQVFSPENLKKYPEWLREKIEGFEENILEVP